MLLGCGVGLCYQAGFWLWSVPASSVRTPLLCLVSLEPPGKCQAFVPYSEWIPFGDADDVQHSSISHVYALMMLLCCTLGKAEVT
jgi:hypothetical protein